MTDETPNEHGPGTPDVPELLEYAVADVEPADRLHTIRQQVARRRRRRLGTGAVALAAAAAVAVVAVVTVTDQPVDDGPDVAGDPPPTSPSDPDDPDGDATPFGPPDGDAVPVYYVGDTPQGPRLYREFHRVDTGEGSETLRVLRAAGGALDLAVSDSAVDPDYRSLWPGTDLTEMGVPYAGRRDDNTYEIPEISVVLRTGHPALGPRPANLTPEEARMAVQALIYTLQGACQCQASVNFVVQPAKGPRDPATSVLGFRTGPDGVIERAPQLEVLSLVSITDPNEGRVVEGTLTARGRASSFEATVPWELRDSSGEVVLEGAATAEGWMGRLYPWETEIDVSDLEPGEYTFVATTADPSGGAEGNGPYVDTRTITVE